MVAPRPRRPERAAAQGRTLDRNDAEKSSKCVWGDRALRAAGIRGLLVPARRCDRDYRVVGLLAGARYSDETVLSGSPHQQIDQLPTERLRVVDLGGRRNELECRRADRGGVML